MNKALIAIDFINDIVDAKGKIPSCAEQVKTHRVIDKANLAISWARNQHIPIIFVKVGFQNNYFAQPKHSPIFGKADQFGALNLSGWGTEFHCDLDVQPHDSVVIKPRVNPFYNTSLDAMLRANKIEQLYFCGVSTSWAIQSAVRDAHDRDYQVHLITDACASHSYEDHQASLAMLERLVTPHLAEEL
ncbi:isochorismatase family cysteine hydrolase [Photobacterium damselae]|uniref:isochorismatase family cysteine hydrolase n=1 Tax=Photobacterium damselae TaxID=38293 RepID=UPI003709EA57